LGLVPDNCVTGWESQALPAVTTDRYSFEDVIAFAPDDAWVVGGSYSSQTQVSSQLIEHWDGGSWTVVDADVPGATGLLSISGTSPSDIWAVGNAGTQTLIEHWDGIAWARVPSPTPEASGTLSSVWAVSANDAWAVGLSTTPDNFLPLVLHWDGASWTVVDTPAGPPQHFTWAVSATGPSDAWIAGYSAVVSGFGNQLVEHWDGNSWQIFRGTPDVVPGMPTSIIALSPADVWVSGDSFTILHWNGSEWQRPSYDLYGVHDFSAVNTSDVWGAGRALIHWNGSSLKQAIAGSDYRFKSVAAVSSPSYNLWAVGERQFPPDSPVILHRCTHGPVAGDIDCDLNVDVMDALAGLQVMTSLRLDLCENTGDCDPALTTLDVVLTLRYVLGIEPRPNC
jgi:hypothetical protein